MSGNENRNVCLAEELGELLKDSMRARPIDPDAVYQQTLHSSGSATRAEIARREALSIIAGDYEPLADDKPARPAPAELDSIEHPCNAPMHDRRTRR